MARSSRPAGPALLMRPRARGTRAGPRRWHIEAVLTASLAHRRGYTGRLLVTGEVQEADAAPGGRAAVGQGSRPTWPKQPGRRDLIRQPRGVRPPEPARPTLRARPSPSTALFIGRWPPAGDASQIS